MTFSFVTGTSNSCVAIYSSSAKQIILIRLIKFRYLLRNMIIKRKTNLHCIQEKQNNDNSCL